MKPIFVFIVPVCSHYFQKLHKNESQVPYVNGKFKNFMQKFNAIFSHYFENWVIFHQIRNKSMTTLGRDPRTRAGPSLDQVSIT